MTIKNQATPPGFLITKSLQYFWRVFVINMIELNHEE